MQTHVDTVNMLIIIRLVLLCFAQIKKEKNKRVKTQQFAPGKEMMIMCQYFPY